eukprot:1511379-Rhodomonas_salina.1
MHRTKSKYHHLGVLEEAYAVPRENSNGGQRWQRARRCHADARSCMRQIRVRNCRHKAARDTREGSRREGRANGREERTAERKRPSIGEQAHLEPHS